MRQQHVHALSSSDAAIICVTASNQKSEWLNFETEALIKTVGPERVTPLIVDLREDELPSHAELKFISMDENGIRRLFEHLAMMADLYHPAEISERRLDEIMAALSLAAGEIRAKVGGIAAGTVGQTQ